jgi:hypothetical protein
MEALGTDAPSALSAHTLVTAQTQLCDRRDELSPLVVEFDRIRRICAAFGDLPDVPAEAGDERPARRLQREVIGRLHEVRDDLRSRVESLEPLVLEHEQILLILKAFETAGGIPRDAIASRRHGRGAHVGQRRPTQLSAANQARFDELRSLLSQPRSRSDLAQALGLSPSRMTELLVPLVRSGEVREIRDTARPSRKLWVLDQEAERPDGAGSAAAPVRKGRRDA